MSDIDNMEDVIDVRDVISRVEELREERDSFVIGAPDGTETESPEQWAQDNSEDAQELAILEELLSDLCGYGRDEQWNSDWYPITLVRESYFESYAQELAEDCGMVKSDAQWPYTCIDWEKAARELRMDYSTVEYDGITYFYR